MLTMTNINTQAHSLSWNNQFSSNTAPTWDTGGSYKSTWSLWTTSLKSSAWKQITSLVIRGRSLLWEMRTKVTLSMVNYTLLFACTSMCICCSVADGCTHHSPNCTAFRTPTAAVLCQSKLWPTWSAWARVRSSKSTSRGSLVLGR